MSIIAHNLFIMFMNLSDIAFLNTEGSDNPCVISLISKTETINLVQNPDLTEKKQYFIGYMHNDHKVKPLRIMRNSQLKRKLSIQEKILNSWENSYLKIKFST